MYTAKNGGEALQNGAWAIRFRDLQTAVTAAFRYAVKQCRALSETDPEPDQSRRGIWPRPKTFKATPAGRLITVSVRLK